MSYVRWEKVCYLCQCPVNISVAFDDDEDETLWDVCTDFLPGDRLEYNALRYKKLGGRVYPTCKSCFDLRFECNPGIIRDLEIGKTRRKRPQTRGYTLEELKVWAETCARIIREFRNSLSFSFS